ncbi:hypothetical protein ACPCJT_31900 [Streptomyces griseoincarnatus]
MSARQRRYAGDVAGGEAKAGTVQACGVAPPAGGVADGTDAYFHHQLGFHQRDVQCLPAAERPACPRMTAPSGSEQPGDRAARRLGESGGAAGVRQAAMVVVPAEQQTARRGERTGDRADDGLGGLADLLVKQAFQ